MQVFMIFLATISVVISVKLIFDARIIAQKYFSFNDKNIAVNVLKILGLILAIVGISLFIKYLN